MRRNDFTNKYTGTTKFNPKSVKAGQGQETLSLTKSSFELLFTHGKIVMDKMFSIIPLSRFIHLVGNSGSKVWSKWTAKTAYQWKVNMICPLAGPDMPGCNCPVKHWTSKKMFVAHWPIYHVGQHVSRIVCKQFKDNVKCHYMTDHEADMKQHVTKVHADKLNVLMESSTYVNENAWLYSGPSRT